MKVLDRVRTHFRLPIRLDHSRKKYTCLYDRGKKGSIVSETSAEANSIDLSRRSSCSLFTSSAVELYRGDETIRPLYYFYPSPPCAERAAHPFGSAVRGDALYTFAKKFRIRRCRLITLVRFFFTPFNDRSLRLR